MPHSRDPERASRQLANLKRGDNPAPVGNRYPVTHGAYARVAVEAMEAKAAAIFDALAADAPLRDRDGGLPAADALVVRLLAETLCQLDGVSADVRDHGWRDRETGDPRPAVTVLDRLHRRALDYAEALGMTPRSRARLGLDLVRTQDAAMALSEPDPERRAVLLAELGVDGDE